MMHWLTCIVCNPITRRRRARVVLAVRNHADGVWWRKLADDSAKDRIARGGRART